MSDLFFNKNKFIKSEPTKLAKPIPTDPTKLGRRTVEQIKRDMHPVNRNINNNVDNNKDKYMNNINKLESLKAFKEWNKK